MQCRLRLVVLAFASASTLGGAATAQMMPTPERPPRPNLHDPVDYFAWYNERNFNSDSPEATAVYPMLFARDDAAGFRVPGRDDTNLNKALNRATRGPWRAADMPEVAAYLQEIAPKLTAYLEATQTADVRWGVPQNSQDDWNYLLPPLDRPRAMAKAAIARAWLEDASAPGDERLTAAWRANVIIARQTGPGGASVVSCMVAAAIRNTTYASIRAALQNGALDRSAIDRTFDILLREDKPIDVAHGVSCELMSAYRLMQFLYPAGNFSDATAEQLRSLGASLPPGGATLPAPEETMEKFEAFLVPQFDIAAEPLTLDAYRRFRDADGRRNDIAGSNAILMTILPSLSRFHALSLRTEADRRATLLMAGLHRHHLAKNAWPQALKEIRLSRFRDDPFSGREFVYELRDGSPILYCVGFDGEDNGGRHDERYAEERPGHDYVYFPVQPDD